MSDSDNLNVVELVSVDNSRITRVSLYTGRAEITRLYTFNVVAGQNQVVISGLPSVLDQESLRVEGRGSATIHDVTISTMPPLKRSEMLSSPVLIRLHRDKQRTENALARCKKALEYVDGYMKSLKIENLDVSKIGTVTDTYDETAEKLNDRVIELDLRLENIDAEILDEEMRREANMKKDKLRLKASIGVFAEQEGLIEIVLIYAVRAASWTAGYDIRVDTQKEDAPVTLIYKAAITQNTGESWEDVPLTLETATPTFGVSVPTLQPWTVSYGPPPPPPPRPSPVCFTASVKSKSGRGLGEVMRYSSMLADDTSEDALEAEGYDMAHQESLVSSTGTVSATFRVPGLINVPCDGEAHSVTIVQLKLDAAMTWIAVPKSDTKVHLKAKIKNSSEYTLLAGTASVYVDGSFISKSNVPAVSPHESFDCPLGLDPSIRVTYHPRNKVVSQSTSLFYGKTITYSFSQRITVHNTKSIPIEHKQLKIVDQIPVSQNSLVSVKLITPQLVVGKGSDANASSPAPPVDVSDGVVAQWEGADEVEGDVDVLGKDGKFFWLCGVPPFEKTSLNFQWEVSAPVTAGSQVWGL
ncbi:Protein F37C4.5 [Hypsizygus marmoreus]|uniref:Protein F37C4.5 n=1 Tax=Hypsizygus marmoreus TaxID=39966 RepID=A0A369KFF5_HYPMA|nr:Protein F37C4.5 [Hypsizygus marmoreus]